MSGEIVCRVTHFCVPSMASSGRNMASKYAELALSTIRWALNVLSPALISTSQNRDSFLKLFRFSNNLAEYLLLTKYRRSVMFVVACYGGEKNKI